MKKYIKLLIILFSLITIIATTCFIPINAQRLIPVVEEQISKELGVNVHVDKLILRTGPKLKLKAPIMHIMFDDGHKFAQFNNIKFYIPWSSLIKDTVNIDKIVANKIILRLQSNDENLMNLLEKLKNNDKKNNPNLFFKSYSITFLNKDNNDNYSLIGNNLELTRISNYKSYKLKTIGDLLINDKKYCNYDLNITPKIDIILENKNFEFVDILNQIKELDFHSDIVADVNLYKTEKNKYNASGFINIDNISVLDKYKKNPKSFIYLTLWGEKASILSNIYASPNSKVYIEGMLNSSKKGIVDVKVKTDEINLSDLYKKVKLFTKFTNLRYLDNVTGSLNANFNLKGDLNKIKSNGYLKVSDASFITNGVKVDKINSEIDFSNNKVNITKAIGYINNSQIVLKGNIDKELDLQLLMNKVPLRCLFPSSFGVKAGVMSLIANISGPLNKISHKENLQIDDFKISKSVYNLNFESLRLDTNKNNTALISNVNLTSKELSDIKIPTLKILINDDFLSIPETNLFMQNSKLTLKSEILNYLNEDLSFASSLNGFINSKDIKRFNQFSYQYPIKLSFNGNKNSQNLSAQILNEQSLIFDEPTIINLLAKLDRKSLKIEDFSLLSLEKNFSDDIKNNIKGSKKILITGSIENLKTPNFKNLRIFIPQQLNLKINDIALQIKGDLFLNNDFLNPDIIGQLVINNLINSDLQISVSNTSLDFNKQNIVVNSPLIKVADTSFSANALISTNFKKFLDVKMLNVKSKYINTDTLLMYKDSPLFRLYPINIKEGKLYSERVLANIYSSPIYMTAFNSDFSLLNDLLNLKNLKAELLNGKMEGEIFYRLKDEQFISKLMARNVSAEPIFNIISTRKDSISGLLDFDVELNGELTSKKSLNGNVKFIVNNGRMSSLGKLEHLLYAQNVIADNLLRTSLSVVLKAITLKDTGLFKFLRGDIDIKEGIATINFMQSQGPLMSLFIKGLYNLDNDYADLTVLGRLSDEIISGLGAFGDFSFNKLMIMLTGEESKTFILPEDYEKIPQLSMKNTKEFRSIIKGIIDKPSSVLFFNWISYSEKQYKQKEVPMKETVLPSFVENLPY